VNVKINTGYLFIKSQMLTSSSKFFNQSRMAHSFSISAS